MGAMDRRALRLPRRGENSLLRSSIGVRWFAVSFSQESFHRCEVFIDSRQPVNPVPALDGVISVSDIRSVNRTRTLRHGGPSRPRFSIGGDGLFQGGRVACLLVDVVEDTAA